MSKTKLNWTAVPLLAALCLAGCKDKTDAAPGGAGTEPAVKMEGDDARLDLSGGRTDTGNPYAKLACDVIDPAELATKVAELEGLTINETMTYGPGTCAPELRPKNTNYTLT